MCDKICESRCSAVLIGAGMGNENMLTLDARTQIEKRMPVSEQCAFWKYVRKRNRSLQSIDLWKL